MVLNFSSVYHVIFKNSYCTSVYYSLINILRARAHPLNDEKQCSRRLVQDSQKYCRRRDGLISDLKLTVCRLFAASGFLAVKKYTEFIFR